MQVFKGLTIGWVSKYCACIVGCPLLVVGSWVMARAYLDDTLCWTTHSHSKRKLFLIIRVPIIISIVVSESIHFSLSSGNPSDILLSI